MHDPDVQREMQIDAEREQDWPTWTERALAQLWTEFGHELPWQDAKSSSEEEETGR